MGFAMMGQVGQAAGGQPPRCLFHFRPQNATMAHHPAGAWAENPAHQGGKLGVNNRMSKTFVPTIGSAEALLGQAQDLYATIATEAFDALKQLKTGEVEQSAALTRAVRDLRDAIKIVMNERTHVDQLRKEIAGVGGNHDLDFDAARDEIGRRLACLREAGGGG